MLFKKAFPFRILLHATRTTSIVAPPSHFHLRPCSNSSRTTTGSDLFLLCRRFYASTTSTSTTNEPSSPILNRSNNNNNNNKWSDLQSRRQFFYDVAKQLNIQHPHDWFRFGVKHVEQRGGSWLLRTYYGGSLLKALREIYPEVEWHPWLFARVPSGFWEDRNNQRQFLDWAAKQISSSRNRNNTAHQRSDPAATATTSSSTTTMEEFEELWYNVTPGDLKRLGGKTLISDVFNGSMLKALSTVYPEIDWKPWRLLVTPPGFWDNMANQRRFFDWCAQRLQIKNPKEDWYRVTLKQLLDILPSSSSWSSSSSSSSTSGSGSGGGGATLLKNYYGNSLPRALAAVYPEIDWEPWRFSRAPAGYWEHLEHHRKYFDSIAKSPRLGVKEMPEDWYSVRLEDIRALDGQGLLSKYYGNSLPRALRTVYPEYDWQPWRFQSVRLTRGTFDSTREEDLARFVEYASKELQISEMDEWYRVSVEQLCDLGGGHAVLEAHGGIEGMLRRAYPTYKWDSKRLRGGQKGKKAAQRWLRVVLQEIFPNEEIVEEFSHPELKFADSGDAMELDVYIPKWRLGFEYHGEHHYKDLSFFGASAGNYKKRDQEKAAACQRAGITLVVVPYWWDRTKSALAATILLHYNNNNNNNNNSNNAQQQQRPASLVLDSDTINLLKDIARGNSPIITVQQQQQQQQQQQHQHHQSASSSMGAAKLKG